MVDYFLVDRLREGRGERRALLTDAGAFTYGEVDDLSRRYATTLLRAGVRPEERVLLALPDGPEFVAALFGALRIGAVAVMLNPHLKSEEIAYFFAYTRGGVLFVASDRDPFFREVRRSVEEDGEPAPGARAPREILVVDSPAFRERIDAVPAHPDIFPTHRDDPAIWLFSGGTTGRPKAVIQTHASFANTTECYARGVLAIGEDDVTLAVPKLFFGYATGSNLLFPFAAGATAIALPVALTTGGSSCQAAEGCVVIEHYSFPSAVRRRSCSTGSRSSDPPCS